MTVLYDSDAGLMRTAFRIENTLIPIVMQSRTFWAFFFLHCIIFFVYQTGFLSEAHQEYSLPFLDSTEASLLSAMTTFVQVFYTNSAYDRYCKIYNMTRNNIRGLHDYILLNKFFFTRPFEKEDGMPTGALKGNRRASLGSTSVLQVEKSQPYLRLSSRLATLGVVVFYISNLHGEVTEAHWIHLMKVGLVTAEEKAFLSTCEPNVLHKYCIDWSSDVAIAGIKNCGMPQTVVTSLYKQALSMSDTMDEVAKMNNLPIPFQYFHLVNIMVFINLIIFAYRFGVTDSLFAPLVFFVVAFLFVGMLDLGQMLSEPFGDDIVDLPVDEWLSEALSSTRDMVELQNAHLKDQWQGVLSEEQQPPMGRRCVTQSCGTVPDFADMPQPTPRRQLAAAEEETMSMASARGMLSERGASRVQIQEEAEYRTIPMLSPRDEPIEQIPMQSPRDAPLPQTQADSPRSEVPSSGTASPRDPLVGNRAPGSMRDLAATPASIAGSDTSRTCSGSAAKARACAGSQNNDCALQ
eukprot:TRINITY_DN7137_c0_g1_i1.p1 TRINITY_DN7137_c0_g1~~TRINITY_DN7137_c0_g1_i1.p1  ORF type:complete len:520 (-),score=112.28 TRINITY_DN7137_c0_g1_i1:417-1976(-)